MILGFPVTESWQHDRSYDTQHDEHISCLGHQEEFGNMLCRQALQSDVAPLTKKHLTTANVAERIRLIFTPTSTTRSHSYC